MIYFTVFTVLGSGGGLGGGGGFGGRWARPRGENGGSTNSQLVLRLRRRGPAASS